MNDDAAVIDSFAWIEYFAGSGKGELAKKYIESGRSITPTIIIAELSAKYAKLKEDFDPKLRFITLKSRTVALDEDIAKLAGTINVERKSKIDRWGIVDSIVLATARIQKVRVVTGDEHFRDLQEVVMIK
jgi:predicted nucleic acid-binding protein